MSESVNVDAQLRQWVKEACQYPPKSLQRQKYLTQVIRMASKKLWRENVSYYQDALQQTWIYFCQNICEAGTGEPYNPDRASVSTWLNAYLRRRLQDFSIDQQQQQIRFASPLQYRSRSGETEDLVNPIDTVAAQPDVPPLLDEVRVWAEQTAELRQVHIAGHSAITCQVLILRRLPPETGWKELADEFGVSISTLSSFYQRQCLPRLRKFGESAGYL